MIMGVDNKSMRRAPLSERLRRGAGAVAKRGEAITQDVSGAVLVELSVLAPILLLLFVGVLQFGPILQQYLILQLAAHQGAQVMADGRTDPSIWTDTTDAISSADASLKGVTVTLEVCNSNGASCSTCNSNSTCATLMGSASGDAARVSLSQSCSVAYALFHLGSTCSVAATEDALIQ